MVQPLIQSGDSFEQPVSAKPASPSSMAAAGKPPPKVTPKPPPLSRPQPFSRPTGLDWLEQGFGQRRAQDDAVRRAKELEETKKRQEQLEQLKALDKKRSRQMYEEIQQQIQLIRRRKAVEPPKYISGAAAYRPDKPQQPESWKEKVKKTILPWTSKQGMGTGEITRGVSG